MIVREHFVVKYSTHVLENEGFALVFLEVHPSIPTPRLYAMYREDGKPYIVMEFKPGRDLNGFWADLTEDETITTLGQLKSV